MTPRFFALATLAGSIGLAAPAAADDAYHVYRPASHAAVPKQAAQYYGGPVIGSLKLAVVIWGSGVAKITDTRIGPFSSAIVNSSYIDQLAQYNTDIKAAGGRQGTGQAITRGSYLGKFRIAPSDRARTLSDADIQAELQAQIASGALPPQDPDTLYMVYFPQSIVITLNSLHSCAQFGAYHEAVPGTAAPTNTFYGVVPDCGGGFNAVTFASSQAIAGAVTDAIATAGPHPKYPQAWAMENGNEIADPCAGDATTLTAAGKTYVVSQVFDAKTNACGTGKFFSP